MAFRVIFGPRAQADIRMAATWLAQASPAAAVRWRGGLLHLANKLTNLPALYPLADEAADLGLELREMLYGRRGGAYRILFTVDGQVVNIHRVRHAAQARLRPGDV